MTNRRSFLKKGAVAASGVTLAASPAANAQSNAESQGALYRIPRFKTGSRLLFQGDSITDMKWGRNEKDRNHYLGHSYVFLIAARLGVDLPGAKLDFYNRGMSGHTVGDLRKRWQKDAVDMNPDLLSILIGINDVGRTLVSGVDVERWEKDYRHILTGSRKANSALRLVLLDPFVVRSGKLKTGAEFKKRRDQVDRLLPVVKSLADDFDAVHVKTQEIFDKASKAESPEHWIWDGVHPLPQGHELIARNWIQSVSDRWIAADE